MPQVILIETKQGREASWEREFWVKLLAYKPGALRGEKVLFKAKRVHPPPHKLPREREHSVWGCLLGPGHPRLELSSDLGILKKQMGLTWVSPAPLSHILVCHLLCAISRTFLGASRSLEGFTRCNCQAGSQPSLLCTQHEAEIENTSFAASPAGNAPKGGQAVSIASFPARPGP